MGCSQGRVQSNYLFSFSTSSSSEALTRFAQSLHTPPVELWLEALCEEDLSVRDLSDDDWVVARLDKQWKR